jgi:hypothetical protein
MIATPIALYDTPIALVASNIVTCAKNEFYPML